MPRTSLLVHRRPRTPSATERTIGLILIVVLGIIVGLFVLSGTRPGPPGLPESTAAPIAATGLPPTTPAGWPRGEVETYDESTLFEKINGKADAYLLYAFDRLECATYTNPTRPDVYVDVYRYVMGSPLDAFGTFRGQRSGTEEALEIGAEAVASGSAVFVRQGSSYVEIVASGPESSNEARAIARSLGTSLEAAPEPVATPKGLPPQGFRILRFDRRGAVGVGALTDAFIAVYEDGMQIVVAQLASAEAAATVATEATADKEFLEEPATFEAIGSRVIGVVGPDEGKRRALIQAVAAAQTDTGGEEDE